MESVIEHRLHLLQDVLATYDEGLLRQLFDDDIAYHLPGHNLISGTYRGKDHVMQLLAMAREHYLTRPYESTVVSVSTSDSHAAIRTIRHASVNDVPLAWTQTTLFFTCKGLVTEVWVFTDNKETYDTYWTP